MSILSTPYFHDEANLTESNYLARFLRYHEGASLR
jgi:hypothetical protein